MAEANKLGIPVVAVVDTNCSPDGIDYIIPGNDDAARAISLYCDLVSRAALDGMSAQMGAAGVDLGALAEAPVEETLSDGVETGNVSDETAHNDAMSKDAPLDIKSSEEVKENAEG